MASSCSISPLIARMLGSALGECSRWLWRSAGYSNPPPDYESGVLPLDYTSGTAHEREDGWCAPRTNGDADAATGRSLTCDDMRRIKTMVLLPFIMNMELYGME